MLLSYETLDQKSSIKFFDLCHKPLSINDYQYGISLTFSVSLCIINQWFMTPEKHIKKKFLKLKKTRTEEF